MIVINKPIIIEDTKKSKLVSKIEINSKEKELWFSVKEENEKYWVGDRVDGFLVVLLIMAMKDNSNIICKAPVSKSLYMSLKNTLIPFLCKINSELNHIKIECEIIEDISKSANHVGTAISCGIDSLSTVITHGLNETEYEYKIDTLTLFNSGYYGNGEGSSENFLRYVEQAENFCEEFGYDLFLVDSNVREFCVYNFSKQFTYLTCSVVLVLQKYFSKYYFSTGYPFYRMEASFTSSSYYESLLLNVLSTKNMKFLSGCSCVSRSEKTKLVFDNPKVYKHVYPCLSGKLGINCGKCEKCIRALLTYDAYGVLEEASYRFNTDNYRKKRLLYISKMLVERHKIISSHYIFNEEIYGVFKNMHRIPFVAILIEPLALCVILYDKAIFKIKGMMSIKLKNKIKKLMNRK